MSYSLKHTSTQNFRISFFFFITFSLSGAEHPREDNPDLSYWAEVKRQHTQTFNMQQVPKPSMITVHVINTNYCESRSLLLGYCEIRRQHTQTFNMQQVPKPSMVHVINTNYCEIRRQHTQTFNMQQVPKPSMITVHVINTNYCEIYSTSLVSHQSNSIRGRCLMSATEVWGWFQVC